MKYFILIALIAISVFLNCNNVSATRYGYCVLQTTENSLTPISGVIEFTQNDDNDADVIVDVNIDGLDDGSYAMHVHEYGDLTSNDGSSAGGHYVGRGSSTHACPDTDDRHEGDMGSWDSSNGSIIQSKTLNLLTLGGEFSIIGRSVVLHALVDSCDGDSGNAGARLAYCTIGIQNIENNNASAGSADDDVDFICNFQPTSNCASCTGTAWLQSDADDDDLNIVARITNGLALNSVHGLHIHQYGDISASDGTSLGGHYNPGNDDHQLPNVTPRHQGDLGNIQSYDSGTGFAWYNLPNSYISPHINIGGRGMVLHQNLDHGSGNGCDSVGSAGSRYAVCVIGYLNPDTEVPTVPIAVNNNFENTDCEAVVDDDGVDDDDNDDDDDGNNDDGNDDDDGDDDGDNNNDDVVDFDDDDDSDDAMKLSVAFLLLSIIVLFL